MAGNQQIDDMMVIGFKPLSGELNEFLDLFNQG